MADEVVYRLVAGDGITLTENPTSKTVEVAVPGLAGKVNTSDLAVGSTAAPGLVELATQPETDAGTDPSRAVSPATLAGRVAREDLAGIMMLASLVEALAMQNATKGMSPLRVGQVLAQFGLGTPTVPLETVNLNNKVISGFYFINGATSANAPYPVKGGLAVLPTESSQVAIQIYITAETLPRIAWRTRVAGTWNGWAGTWTTANFDPASKANTSGNYPQLSVGSAQSANFATGAGNANTLGGYPASSFALTSGGYPSLSAGYAINAGNADTVDGYHASQLWRADQSALSGQYVLLPNGCLMQWATVGVSYAGTGVTFPIAFPNACWAVLPTLQAGGPGFVPRAGSITRFGCSMSGGLNASTENVTYWAVGN